MFAKEKEGRRDELREVVVHVSPPQRPSFLNPGNFCQSSGVTVSDSVDLRRNPGNDTVYLFFPEKLHDVVVASVRDRAVYLNGTRRKMGIFPFAHTVAPPICRASVRA